MRIMRPLMCAAVFLAASALSRATDLTGNWVLVNSELTYMVSHPLHHVDATSRSARGKGTADASGARFLIAVPVKTFSSGDTNRDLHMLQVTKAGNFPMVTVRVVVKGDARQGPVEPIKAAVPLKVDATVTFAGCTTTYQDVVLSVSDGPDGTMHVTGTLPLTVKDFNLVAPSLLGIPIKNEIPVILSLYWKKK